MGANYDFYQNPPSANGKKRLHARVVSSRTIDTNELAEEIQDRSTVSTADVKATLVALTELVVSHFRDGHRIHIDGLGYFQVTLSCPPVRTPKDIRAESIRFKSVAFRPEKGLLKHLKGMTFVRTPLKVHSRGHAEDIIEERLTRYFSMNPTLSREDFQRLCGFTKTTANRRLKKLTEEGKLQKSGLYKFPVYEPVKGYFGRE